MNGFSEEKGKRGRNKPRIRLGLKVILSLVVVCLCVSLPTEV